MSKKQEIEELFNILHDGVIETAKLTNSDLKLTIDIQYLAELINKRYELIIVVLTSIKKVAFEPWTNEFKTDSSWIELFDSEIEIIKTETNEIGEIIIHSRCHNAKKYGFEGGQLLLDCEDYKIFDEVGTPLPLTKLKEISSYYWNEKFGKE